MAKIKVHAEIEYDNRQGIGVHSDICPVNCSPDNMNKKYRKFLHECLDEWLDKSRGTGAFYIAEEGYEIERKESK